MKRLTWFLALAALTATGPACSDDCGLSGSQCELIECNFDKLTCQLYAPPNDAYKLIFKQTLDEGSIFAAIIVIDLIGIETTSGLTIEGPEFAERVDLYRIDEDWPAYQDGKLTISEGGRQPGEALDGKASFRFDNGYFVSACFQCTLEAAEPE